MYGKDGQLNDSADKVHRVNRTWSDTNLNRKFDANHVFDRLICRNCGNLTFEVLGTGSYETSARCVICGFYYKVHCG